MKMILGVVLGVALLPSPAYAGEPFVFPICKTFKAVKTWRVVDQKSRLQEGPEAMIIYRGGTKQRPIGAIVYPIREWYGDIEEGSFPEVDFEHPLALFLDLDQDGYTEFNFYHTGVLSRCVKKEKMGQAKLKQEGV